MPDPATLVREARRAASLTQAQLAARAQTTQSAIARLESGRTSPTVANLDRVLRAAGRQLELRAPDPGIDISLLRANLALSPSERLAQFERAYAGVRELAQAGAGQPPCASGRPCNALLRSLLARGVDLVVEGSYAAAAHGASPSPLVLELGLEGGRSNLDRLGSVLAEYNARPPDSSEEIDVLRTAATAETCLLSDEGPLRIRVPTEYAQLRQRANVLDLGDQQLPVVALDDLISAKRASPRAQDAVVLVELEKIAHLRAEQSDVQAAPDAP